MRVVVVGGGIAGLVAALEASATHDVTLLTKADLGVSATAHAQGGVAVAGPAPDSVAAHVADTVAAGAGLVDAAAAQALCAGGPDAIVGLRRRGVVFDGVPGTAGEVLARGLEAAHSHARILHAGGDATGAEISRALVAELRRSDVTVLERTTVTDLVSADGVVVGVRLLGGTELAADAVVLATGGAGQLYPHTTNPGVATGDGVAIALRAGAAVADLEFYQFHPTALAGPGSFLVSEAVRGEGAVLLDARGRRFMLEVHPDAELAPRDVVARAIAAVAAAQGEPVRLDATALGADFLARRFPTIVAACAARGLDLARDPVPVTPAAHYWMGGVRTDVDGRTSLPGLWAVGEVACTGVHGANRLASNSLLEGAVFARRAVRSLTRPAAREAGGPAWSAPSPIVLDDAADAAPFARDELHTLMWAHAGLQRDAEGLALAATALAGLATPDAVDSASAEDRNLLTCARALVAAAQERTASVGAHHRTDSLPALDPPRHSVVAGTPRRVLVGAAAGGRDGAAC
ncbi:L-aspartate oxidase [Beutenbergia cavernae DSM 12333]|uniref:L-aspartate oxidase n=1 Tax=Beutenbergia cavernae (strain ATCC BAA-8 / DSM 12333 / CCUG 43141 / JCM 11478 / NBRC 16432 / NCIMB 13614 / HKI 0122) TaxID=471853 RepID=C5BYC0_BEUC1|nr:L-aspartate oxidase [Beutenbergia cavernae]ACQ81020.1 L-aspartate oxidase [Beutenbergia cavernae DSM 12333]